MNLVRIFSLLGIGIASLYLTACQSSSDTAAQPQKTAFLTASPINSGKELMELYCQSCHQLPNIHYLSKTTWRDYVLVRMSAYMGIYHDGRQFLPKLPNSWLEPGIGGQRVMQKGIFPQQAMLSQEQWLAIADYIISEAPNQTEGAFTSPLQHSLPHFRAKPLLAHGQYQPVVTTVSIDTFRHRIYAAYRDQALVSLHPDGRIEHTLTGYRAPVQILPDANWISVVDIGNMRGSDKPLGFWQQAPSFKELNNPSHQLAGELQRPVQACFGDLDLDGDLDAVLCEFGHQLGQLTWQERLSNGKFTSHALHLDDGALAGSIADINQDDKPDIIALIANGDEGVFAYLNQGSGKFISKRILRFDPGWGSTAMKVLDWNQDGLPDLVCANGDNADYPAILKSHHGIRIYLNRGNLHFEQAIYIGFDGAYDMEIADFDEDGDLDLATVSFYPDFNKQPTAGFVYFQQQQPGKFQAFTFPEVDHARWMTLDAGDADRDGDLDLILGGYDIRTSEVPAAVVRKWAAEDAPLMYLENVLR